MTALSSTHGSARVPALIFFLVCLATAAASSGEEAARPFGNDDFFWTLSITVPRSAEKVLPGRLLELLPGTGGKSRLLVRLGPAKASMVRVGRKQKELCSAVLDGMPRVVTLVRRGRIHYLLADGRLVLKASYAGAHVGRRGATARGAGLSVRELLRQRTAALLFTDSFSRLAGKPGPWKPSGGQWESAARSSSAHSANPGALRARFSSELPRDPFADGRVYGKRNGLGANLALLAGGGMAVTRVTGSSPVEKAGLRVGDVLLSLRGQPLAKSRRLILQAGHEVEMTVLRSGENKVRTIKVKPEVFTWGQNSRSVSLPGAAPARVAFLTAGHDFWGVYRAEVSVRVRGSVAAGMVFAIDRNGDGLLYRLKPGKKSWRAEIVKLGRDGVARGEPIASKSIGVPWSDSWYRLAVDVSDDGRPGGFRVRCFIGDVEVLQGRSPLAGFGRVGLWAAGDDGYAEFDDVAVSNDREELVRRGKARPRFSAHAMADAFMSAWSRPPARPAAVRSASGIDLGFDRAPTEVVATAGSWGLANRWICDPRWSWFAGRADPLCSIWTARRFDGDQQLEATVALMMTNFRSPHEIPRDIGLTICGDGRSLWSGYTLVFGADNNRCTRLYREGRLVAETRKEAARFPNDFFKNPSRSALHQKWYRLGLAKREGKLLFSVNGREQLSWPDPHPLAGGRMAVWKLRGGVLLARLRADAAKVGPLMPDLQAAPRPDAGAPVVAVPGVGSAVEIDSRGEGVWRLRSLIGGSCAVSLRGLEVEAAAGGLLKFRLRVPPGVAIDLYLESAGKRYRLGLTGPTPDPGAEEREVRWLGRVPGITADGRWHDVALKLGSIWRDYWRRHPSRRKRPPSAKYRLVLGCYAQAGYHCSGLGANPPGSWYELTAPGLVKPERDTLAPSVGQPRLVGNTRKERARIILPISDPGGAGLDTRTLSVTLGGKPLKVGQAGVSYSEVSGELVVDLGAAGVKRSAAGDFSLSLKGIKDLAGNKQADKSFKLTLDEKADARPPESVAVSLVLGKRSHVLTLGPRRIRGAGWSGRFMVRGHYPEVSGGPEGGDLLALVDGSFFCAYVTSPARRFDLGRCPEFDMSCRFGPTAPLALSFGAWRSRVVAALNEAPVGPNGRRAWRPAPALAADRTWQRVSIPMVRLYNNSRASQTRRPVVSSLQFGDTGARRSRAGTHLSIGDLQLVPVVNPRGLTLSWGAWDAGKVVDYRSALDNKPRTSPKGKALESGKALPGPTAAALKEGNAWLHLCFKDGSGNWSSARSYRLIVDRTPPRASMPGLVKGVGVRCDGFDIRLMDAGGVAPESIVLTVNGKAYQLGKGHALSFDPTTARLRWNARGATGKVLSAGQELSVNLACADYAGNAMVPAKWTWKVDPAGDKLAPSVPRVRFSAAGRGHKPLEGVGRRLLHPRRFSPISGVRLDILRTPEVTARMTRTDARAPLVISLEPMPWRTDYYSCLQFEYCATPGMRLELVLDISGQDVVLPLLGLPGAAGVADGKWHRMGIDLGEVSRRKLGALPLYCVWKALLREPRGGRNKPGSSFQMRKAELWTGRALGTRFEIDSGDAGSGLAGFSVALDRKADTMPPEKLNLSGGSGGSPSAWKPGKLKAGVWWLHVRAADLAGNWSEPRHFRLVVPETRRGVSSPVKERPAEK
jgi:hypothetical protein